MRDITAIPSLVAGLPPDGRERFHRIFTVQVDRSRLVLPPPMVPRVEERFGSARAVEEQWVVRVTNRVTGEETVFNPLRGRRPMPCREGPTPAAPGDDPFADPYASTPADPFGRVEGRFTVTGANLARAEVHHAVVVFGYADPLAFTAEALADHLETAYRWFQEAHRWDREAIFPLLTWNCLWRAGASIYHGHLQAFLARGHHYARVEMAHRSALAYRQELGRDYFEDLFAVHRDLGCGLERQGVRVMAYLTPVKEREVVLLAPRWDPGVAGPLYRVLAGLRDSLGVRSFNLALWFPPLDGSWEGFPLVARAVDRGEPGNPVCDIGAMELYAHSLVSSNPLELGERLREWLA